MFWSLSFYLDAFVHQTNLIPVKFFNFAGTQAGKKTDDDIGARNPQT